MEKPVALLPWAPGTNCHHETAYALELAGAQPQIVPLDLLISGRRNFSDADIHVWCGGFSHGDHFRSGTVAALDLTLRLREALHRSLNRGIPMLGICNGFQVLVAAGLLPLHAVGVPTAALDLNRSGNFEHWSNVTLVLHEPNGCIWTQGLAGKRIRLPVAHGEGRLVISEKAGKVPVVATYGTPEGTTEYPASPNGSPIAGICDERGLIMGLMPHPERRVDELHGGTDGLAIFQNAVKYVS